MIQLLSFGLGQFADFFKGYSPTGIFDVGLVGLAHTITNISLIGLIMKIAFVASSLFGTGFIGSGQGIVCIVVIASLLLANQAINCRMGQWMQEKLPSIKKQVVTQTLQVDDHSDNRVDNRSQVAFNVNLPPPPSYPCMIQGYTGYNMPHQMLYAPSSQWPQASSQLHAAQTRPAIENPESP
ncbi:MAG: hypothetical protein K0S07_706 [Chlamydiales bacterium]|nr:hypothetical protein [Chlamydiales bacterium]